MIKVYQYSIKDDPTSESDWVDCNENVYKELVGYGPTRIIEREVRTRKVPDGCRNKDDGTRVDSKRN